jgi:hypothetical protein
LSPVIWRDAEPTGTNLSSTGKQTRLNERLTADRGSVAPALLAAIVRGSLAGEAIGHPVDGRVREPFGKIG